MDWSLWMSLLNRAYRAAVFCFFSAWGLVTSLLPQMLQSLKFFPCFPPPERPCEFQPLLAVRDVAETARVARIKRTNGPLVSLDSGTHYNTPTLNNLFHAIQLLLHIFRAG